MSDEIPVFKTTKELGEIFAVKAQTIRLWIDEGKFPEHRRVGRKYLIPMSDVKNLLNAMYGDKPEMNP